MTTTTWRLCVTMESLFQHSDNICFCCWRCVYWACYRCILHLQQYSHRLNLLLFFFGILSTYPNNCTLPFFVFWGNIRFSIHFHQLLIGADPPYVIFFHCDKYFHSIFPDSWGVSIAFHQCPDFQTRHYYRRNHHFILTGSRISGCLLVFWENHLPLPYCKIKNSVNRS